MSTRKMNGWSRFLMLLLTVALISMPALSALAEAAPVADAAPATYVTRQEAVSGFVQSIGRNNINGVEHIL